MSNGAPAKNNVRKHGPSIMSKCDIKKLGVCIATECGPVQVFRVVENKQQLHVCLRCFEQLVISGQWVEQPQSSP